MMCQPWHIIVMLTNVHLGHVFDHMSIMSIATELQVFINNLVLLNLHDLKEWKVMLIASDSTLFLKFIRSICVWESKITALCNLIHLRNNLHRDILESTDNRLDALSGSIWELQFLKLLVYVEKSERNAAKKYEEWFSIS